MRASRLISLLLLLQNRGHATAAELADELGVSTRTVYRDLEALASAVWRDRSVRFSYERGDGRAVEREADAVSLTLKSGFWYLVARVGSLLRVYRVSRMSEVAVSEVEFVRDPAFDLASFWSNGSSDFEAGLEAIPVTVRVAPAAQARVAQMGDPATRPPADSESTLESDGWLRRTLVLEKLEYALAQLLGFGAEVEVIEPAELRAQLAEAALRLSELYAGSEA